MATVLSDGLTARKPVAGYGSGGGQIRCERTTVTVPAAAATTDIFRLFRLPPHARVQGGWIKTPDLDTSTNVTLNVGDTGGYTDQGVAITADPDRYFAAFTGQAAGVNTVMAATGYGFYSGARGTEVQLVLQAGPTTTAGSVEVSIFYTCEEPQ